MRNRIFRRGLSRQVGLLAMLAAIMLGSVAQAQGTRPVLTNETAATPAGADGPVQLRPSVRQVRPTVQDPNVQRGLTAPFFGDPLFPPAPLPRRELDEFEQFVSRLAGPSANGQPTLIRRFGTELQDRDPFESIDQEALPLVPPDYVVQPGDEIKVALWGSVDADLTLTVDRGGSITLPRVGGIVVAGARFSELNERVRRRAAQTFKNFDVSVSMGKLRAVRVFVTGFVANPGTYTVGGLSTISRAVLRAGGPAPSGSYRQISLRRAGQPALTFDMYDLLVKGERRNDVTLRPDDVVHVGAVGPQVALIGHQIAVAALDGDGAVRWTASLGLGGRWAWTYSGDGTRLAAVGSGGGVVLDTATGEQVAAGCAWRFGASSGPPLSRATGVVPLCR